MAVALEKRQNDVALPPSKYEHPTKGGVSLSHLACPAKNWYLTHLVSATSRWLRQW